MISVDRHRRTLKIIENTKCTLAPTVAEAKNGHRCDAFFLGKSEEQTALQHKKYASVSIRALK